MEELAEDAALCCLVRHARTTGCVGLGASLLLLEACEGGHEAGASAATAGVGVLVVLGSTRVHDCGCGEVDDVWFVKCPCMEDTVVVNGCLGQDPPPFNFYLGLNNDSEPIEL